MPVFSKKSLEKKVTCDKKLQAILDELIKEHDFVIICGNRNKEDQDAAVKAGNSRTPWPTSKHNTIPSQAVDIAPYKNGGIDWNDIPAFMELAAQFQIIANRLNIKIRWGGTFTSLKDYPHFELA